MQARDNVINSSVLNASSLHSAIGGGSDASAANEKPASTVHIHHPHAPNDATGIELEWYVGGASKVDCTFLAWHHHPSGASKDHGSNWSKYLATLDSASVHATFAAACLRKPSSRKLNSLRMANEDPTTSTYTATAKFPVVASRAFDGASRWAAHPTGSTAWDLNKREVNNTESIGNDIAYSSDDPMRPLSTYRAAAQPRHADTDKPFAPGRYWLVAWSMVDQHYGKAGRGYPADSLPQSHLSNVRTNAEWRKSAGNRSIHGRLYWPSDPVEVVVHDNGSYHVASTVTHCAWWDRAQIEEHDVQDARPAATGWFGGRINATDGLAQDLFRNMFDPVTYRPAGEQSGSAYKLYGITLGLLLITAVCCVVLYYMWRRSSIYAQVVNNKYANFSSLKTFRGRVTTNTVLSPTKL